MRRKNPPIPLALEFTLVVGVTYGMTVFGQLWRALTPSPSGPIQFNNGSLLYIVAFELFLGGIALSLLKFNGWSKNDFRLSCSLTAHGMGLVLFISSYIFIYIIYYIIYFWMGKNFIQNPPATGGHLSLPVVIITCIVNPFFEEGILLGYVVKVLKGQGLQIAIGVSLALRLSTHLYQGPHAVISILPIGLLFSLFYWKFENLWPPVLAHLILDAIPLLHWL